MEDVLRAHTVTNVPMQKKKKKDSLAESFAFKCCFNNAASEVVKVLAGLAHLDRAAGTPRMAWAARIFSEKYEMLDLQMLLFLTNCREMSAPFFSALKKNASK